MNAREMWDLYSERAGVQSSAEMAATGGSFDEKMKVVCEEFIRAYP